MRSGGRGDQGPQCVVVILLPSSLVSPRRLRAHTATYGSVRWFPGVVFKRIKFSTLVRLVRQVHSGKGMVSLVTDVPRN